MKRSALIRVIRGAVLGLLLVSLAAAPAAATVTVTGHVKIGDTTAPATNVSKIRMQLMYCVQQGQNTPRVIGTGALISPQFDIVPAGDGSYSKTIYANDEITCDTIGNSRWRQIMIYNNGQTSYNEYNLLVSEGPTINMDTHATSSSGVTAYVPDALLKNPGGAALQTVNGPVTFTGAITVPSCTGCGVGGGGGGITTLDTLNAATQTFSRTNDTNLTLVITPSGSDHNFTLGWSGTLAKARQFGTTVYADQANTFGAFLQKFQAGANFQLVDPTDTTKITQFDVSNIATSTTRTVNIPNANSTTAQAKSSVGSQWLNSMSAQGVFTSTQPAFTDISGSVAAGQMPALTGDATSSAGTVATTVGKVNGVAYSASPSTDTTPVITAANTATYSALPSCSNAVTSKLLYNTSTHAYSCGTDQGGGGGMTNPMTTLGDIIYEDATPTPARLAGNTSATKMFFSQTGNGSISAAPAWGQPAFTDITGTSTKAQSPAADVYTDQANTFGAFLQKFQAGANFQLVDPSDTTKITQFDVSNIATSTTRTVNIPNANSTTAQAKSSVGSQWLNSMSAQGVFTSTQPAFTDISGTSTKAQSPAADVYTDQANTFGAFLQKLQAGANLQLVDPTDTTKITQFDVSNIATSTTRTVNIPNANSTTAQAKSSVGSQWLNSMSAQGVFTSTQPAIADLSDAANVVTPSSTHTLTNKTYDAEGTGNTLTIPVVVYQDVGGCNNATPTSALDLPTANAPTPNCLTGTNAQQGTLDYADGANSTGQTKLVLPTDWTGNIDIDLYWLVTASGGSNAVKWTVATACSAAAATYDTAFNTAQTITTNVGANNNVTVSTQTTLTSTGCSADNLLHLKIGRDVTDTFTGTARLLGFRLKLRRAM